MARMDYDGAPGNTTPPSQAKRGEIALGKKTNPNVVPQPSAKEYNLGTPVYRYPTDGAANFPARMKFGIYQVDAYKVDTTELKEYWDVPLLARAFGRKVTPSVVAEDLSGMEGDDDFIESEADRRRAAVAAKEAQASADGKAGRSGKSDLKVTKVDGAPVVQIYMPQALQFADTMSYNQADLGVGGLTALAGINAGSSLVGAVTKGLSEGLESIFNLATGQISGSAAQVAAARLSNKIPSVGLKAAAATAIQTGVNPGTRMIFDRPNVREFTFTFKFISTSAQEATQVEKIIRTFREEMYPETIDLINGVPAGYKFPNLFKIEFEFLGATSKLPAIQYSYLRACNVTYNASSMTFHADGQPTEVDMTLTFQEYRALSKQDIQKGY